MHINAISSGADGAHNEDLVAVFQRDGLTDIIILDGGTSVAERDYIDADAGDVVWFVTGMRERLERAIAPGRSQKASIALALAALRTELHARCDAGAIPAYAWPIAAMTWLRIGSGAAGASLDAWCVGDCKTLLQAQDGSVVDLDPYHNPQEHIVQAALRKLSEEGVSDGAARRARLTPMLRERRIAQNRAAAPGVLCLDPQGPFAARVRTARLEPASTLLAMTDGFYRMVDTYAMYSQEELASLCRTRGVAAMLAELRAFEAAALVSHSLSVKRADDASAVVCALPPLTASSVAAA